MTSFNRFTFAAMVALNSVALLFATGAHSQSCQEIDNDLDRLACYDSKFAPTSVQTAAPDENGDWIIRTEKSDFKDTIDVFVSVNSNDELACNRFGSAQKATLLLRCQENTTSLFIVTDCHLTSGHQGYGRVEYRIDDNTSQTRSFQASTDNSALGLWSGGKSIPMIKELFGGKRMLTRFTPFSMSPVTAEFNIEGVETAVKGLRKECGW